MPQLRPQVNDRNVQVSAHLQARGVQGSVRSQADYAGMLLTYYREGMADKTAVERHTGQKHPRPTAEFGENVMYLPSHTKEDPSTCHDSARESCTCALPAGS